MLAALLRAESWLRTSAIFICGRLLRKQAWGKDEEMGGGGQGWTDWARPTQTQEVPLLCGKCFIITAKVFYFSHSFLFIKDPWEFWFSVSWGRCKEYYRQTDRHIQTHRIIDLIIICPRESSLSFCCLRAYLEKTAHLFKRRGCNLQLEVSEASYNISRETEETLWRAANNVTTVLH